MEPKLMNGVREYSEELGVYLHMYGGRFVVLTYSDGGLCNTQVDLLNLIAWLKSNHPHLLGMSETPAWGEVYTGRLRADVGKGDWRDDVATLSAFQKKLPIPAGAGASADVEEESC